MLIAVCLLFLLTPFSVAQAATHVEVTVDQLNIRSAPDTTSQIVGTITKATRLSIVSQRNGWTQVKLANGQSGWLNNKYVKMIEIPRIIYVKSTVDMLNVRAEPNATAQILQIIDKNGVFLQVKKQGSWAQIKLSDKVNGWVNASYLTETAAPAPAPTPAPPPPVLQTPAPNPNLTPTEPAAPPAGVPAAPPAPGVPAAPPAGVPAAPPALGVPAAPPAGVPVAPPAPSVPVSPPISNVPPTVGVGLEQTGNTLVLHDGFEVFSDPDIWATVVGWLPAGTVVTHQGNTNGWYKISYNGTYGYIFGPTPNAGGAQGQPNNSPGTSTPVPAAPAQTEASIRVKNPDTNLRSGPGTDYAVVGVVQPGQTYPIIQTEGDWYLIRMPDQSSAYIAGWIVELVQPAGSAPGTGTGSPGVGYNAGMIGNETVYIYHTHNRESWHNVAKMTQGSSVDDPVNNITLVGKRLGELLQAKGVPTMVSQDDFAQKLAEQKKSFAMSYTESYKAVVAAANTSPHLKYLFDIHRDGNEPRSKVAHTLNGKTYARILFVIGTANPNYQENKNLAEHLHAHLEAAYPGLSRGIILKGKNEGNGEYNQSISGGSLLLEIGGTNNTLEECYNTAEALSEVIVRHMLESQLVYK
nr:stage II sporulation protein P [Brevibacillus ruminantium]